MAGLHIQLSRAKDLARFRRHVRHVAKTSDINDLQVRQHLLNQAQAWNVHSVDAEQILREVAGHLTAPRVPKALPASQNPPLPTLPKTPKSTSLATTGTQKSVPRQPSASSRTPPDTSPVGNALPRKRTTEIQIVVSTSSLPIPSEFEDEASIKDSFDEHEPTFLDNPLRAFDNFLNSLPMWVLVALLGLAIVLLIAIVVFLISIRA